MPQQIDSRTGDHIRRDPARPSKVLQGAPSADAEPTASGRRAGVASGRRWQHTLHSASLDLSIDQPNAAALKQWRREGEVDSLDREILVTLQRESRISNLSLARSLGLSPSAMVGRVKRLERRGAIRGYRALIDPTVLGITVQAWVLVQLQEHSERAISVFEEGIQRVPEVRACYHLTGRFDMIVLLAVRNLDDLARLIRADIARIPGVSKLETMMILAESVVDDGWPILPEPSPPEGPPAGPPS